MKTNSQQNYCYLNTPDALIATIVSQAENATSLAQATDIKSLGACAFWSVRL